jgi:hypothetical protein
VTTRVKSYEGLTREELIHRLERAEAVCVLYAWSPVISPDAGDRQLACLETWMAWAHAVPAETIMRSANPHLTDETIHTLAEMRRATREWTLTRIRGEAS